MKLSGKDYCTFIRQNIAKSLFCNSGDGADSNGNTELPVTYLTFVKYVLKNGFFWNVLFVFRKTVRVTLSTKYAEKDGVGGFAPSAFNATPSGLDPGGDLGSCSKSWWWRDRKEVVGGEWKKSCRNSKICHRKIGCFDINYFEKRNMKKSHFSFILPSLRVILTLMAHQMSSWYYSLGFEVKFYQKTEEITKKCFVLLFWN